MNMEMDLMTIIGIILGSLLSLSEILALIPGVKSNSVFQLLINIIKALLKKKE
jgi:hypothetical protein